MGFFSKHYRTIAILISIILLVILFKQINLNELTAAISKANPLFVAGAIGATLLSLGVRTLRWKVLLDERASVSLPRLFPIQCAGLAVSNFSPGKAADPIKTVFLKPLGVPYSFSILTVVWERLFDLFLLFSASLLVASGVGKDLTYVAFAALAALVGVVLLVHKKLGSLIRLLSSIRFLSFLKNAQTHKFNRTTLAKALALTFVIWSIDFTAAFLAFSSIGINLDYLFLAGATSASILVGVITFLPGGVGSTELSFLFFLSLTGYPQGQLLAGIMLSRLSTLGFSSILGLSMLPFMKAKKS